MNSRTRTLQKTDKFIIRKRTRRSNGKNYYELSCNMHSIYWNFDDYEKVRNIVDPTRNRAGKFGTTWKYKTQAEAERALTHLLMVL